MSATIATTLKTTNPWTDILNTEQLEASYALTAQIDPAFAAGDRKFWESRSVNQLHSLRASAWHASEATSYQMARSYLALKGEVA